VGIAVALVAASVGTAAVAFVMAHAAAFTAVAGIATVVALALPIGMAMWLHRSERVPLAVPVKAPALEARKAIPAVMVRPALEAAPPVVLPAAERVVLQGRVVNVPAGVRLPLESAEPQVFDWPAARLELTS
jgi:hypothetical protein